VSISSDDSLDIRLSTAPLWVCGFYPGRPYGRFYVWVKSEDEEIQGTYITVPTTLWTFAKSSGELAQGQDPLDFWDEWDVEAGDREVPILDRDKVNEFVEKCRSGMLSPVPGTSAPVHAERIGECLFLGVQTGSIL